MESADVKPGQQPLTIKIRESDGKEIAFKVKRSTPMRKVFEAFAKQKNATIATFKFLFDGTRIKEDDTADSLDMDEDSLIDAQLEMVGGSQ